jgi:septum site-determining protein MinC
MRRDETEPTLYVRHTLRSGQRVRYDGSVVVIGDVNPGAEVVAGRDVIVLGTMRGMAHAGCHGDGGCAVMALRLEPTQIRIGKLVSRPPEGRAAEPSGPERARVVDGRVVIERWLSRAVGGTRGV